MNKNYHFLTLILSLFIFVLMSPVQGQVVGDTLWEDHFDDPVQDYLLNNVGWIYYPPEEGLIGQEVYQTEAQTAFIKAGIYKVIAGVAVIETNGVSYIDPTDSATIAQSEKRMKTQTKTLNPNQQITFQINFKKMTEGTNFLCCARMFDDDTSDAYPDPTEDTTHVLLISPLTNTTIIAKIKENKTLDLLNPAAWTVLGQSTEQTYILNFPTWVKFYLYEGDIKVKVWLGDFVDDEPVDWLIDVTDPDPWVKGVFTLFGLLGAPLPDGDEIELDDVVVREVTSADAIDQPFIVAPARFTLASNYPNPFNPETTIEFSLDKANDVTLNVYSITGQLVRTLINQSMAVGDHLVKFNGRDDLGQILSSGVYFYQLQSGDQVATNKMILMK
jgi:hypothetical protein